MVPQTGTKFNCLLKFWPYTKPQGQAVLFHPEYGYLAHAHETGSVRFLYPACRQVANTGIPVHAVPRIGSTLDPIPNPVRSGRGDIVENAHA